MHLHGYFGSPIPGADADGSVEARAYLAALAGHSARRGARRSFRRCVCRCASSERSQPKQIHLRSKSNGE